MYYCIHILALCFYPTAFVVGNILLLSFLVKLYMYV